MKSAPWCEEGFHSSYAEVMHASVKGVIGSDYKWQAGTGQLEKQGKDTPAQANSSAKASGYLSSERNPCLWITSSCCLGPKSCTTLQSHELQHASLPVLPCFPELLILMPIESVMPSNHLILCHPLLLLPSIFPSIREGKHKMKPKRWRRTVSWDLIHRGIILRLKWKANGNLKSGEQ